MSTHPASPFPLRYQVLGPVRILRCDRWHDVSPPKAAAVLGCLLMMPNELVSVQRLVQCVWGDAPPRRANASIHVYISQLRKQIGYDADGSSPLETVTSGTGYLIRVRPGELDSVVFQDLVEIGRERAATGADEEAEAVLLEAMAMWTGRTPAALWEGAYMDVLAASLDEALLECIELRMEVGLRLGRHRQLASQLRRLTVEHPLHEGFWACRMRALWACNRRADALAVFRTARDVLDRELGLAPGPDLQQLQNDILTDTPPRADRAARPLDVPVLPMRSLPAAG